MKLHFEHRGHIFPKKDCDCDIQTHPSFITNKYDNSYTMAGNELFL